jgi:4-hydroxythreonine-4-phosphate dehydrogenase
VTAPLNKEALSEAGWIGVGHTELLARFAGVPDKSVAMMLASNRLRVVHVSTHVSLRRAIELATAERIVTTARLAGATARDIVGREPHLAVAGLNPHAGEHGLFGTEEQEHIEPAIEQLRAEGWQVSGPVSPDTVFLRAANGDFDAVVAMYHDQGHIPSKFAGFDDTVNVTLGLPIVRTSVDHGTAYDIAGTGAANEANMLAAIELAARMAMHRAKVKAQA